MVEVKAGRCVLCVVERLLDEDIRNGSEEIHHDSVDIAHEVLTTDLVFVRKLPGITFGIFGGFPTHVNGTKEIAVRSIEGEGELCKENDSNQRGSRNNVVVGILPGICNHYP